MFAWLEHFLTTEVAQYGLVAVFITMALESACIPIPSEIVMPYAGHLVARGQMGLWEATLVAGAANLTGSWIAYAAGRFGGRGFIEKYGRYILLSQKHLAMADRWFANRGEMTVFVSRMLPAVRTFISLPAGIAKMNLLKFSVYSFIGALPWNLALVYLGYIFTDRWDELQAYLHEFNYVVFVALGLLVTGWLLWRRRKRFR
ncbi:MAG: DedA family protein [Bacillota bacterium]